MDYCIDWKEKEKSQQNNYHKLTKTKSVSLTRIPRGAVTPVRVEIWVLVSMIWVTIHAGRFQGHRSSRLTGSWIELEQATGGGLVSRRMEALVLGQVLGHGWLEVTDAVGVLVRSWGGMTRWWTGVTGHGDRRPGLLHLPCPVVSAQSRVGGRHRCLQSNKIE